MIRGSLPSMSLAQKALVSKKKKMNEKETKKGKKKEMFKLDLIGFA